MKDFLLYAVGQPHPIGKGIPAGATCAVIHPSGIEIMVCLDRLTKGEIRRFRKGTVELGLFIHPDAPLVPMITGLIPGVIDFAQSLDARLEPEAAAEFLDSGGTGYSNAFNLVLTDEFQIIRAMRTLGVSQEFARRLHDALIDQLRHQSDPPLSGIRDQDRLEARFTNARMHAMAVCRYRFKRKP